MMTSEHRQAQALMDKKVHVHKLETPEQARERKRTICMTCVYFPTKSEGLGYCEYRDIMGTQRPCAPSECVEKGVYIKGKARQRKKSMPGKVTARSSVVYR